MEFKEITKLSELPEGLFGVVWLACDVSTQENADGFLNGLGQILSENQVHDAALKPEDLYDSVYKLQVYHDRTDIFFMYKNEVLSEEKVQMGRYAMVRLACFGNELKWLSDYRDNEMHLA